MKNEPEKCLKTHVTDRELDEFENWYLNRVKVDRAEQESFR